MKTVEDYNFKSKKVFVRCDFNVPIKDGQIKSDFRIKRALPTLRLLKKQGAKIIIGTHIGRPLEKPKSERKKYSTLLLKEKLEKLLGEEVQYSKKITGRKPKSIIKKMKPGSFLLLENLRFNEGERKNNKEFADELADLADIYVNESFSVSHRKHASVVGVSRLLPSFAGLNLKKEIEVLDNILEDPKTPLTVVVGGAKVKSKVRVVEELSRRAQNILIGGKLVSLILRVKGYNIGKAWPSQEVVKFIKDLNLTNQKIHMPVDVLVSPDESGKFYVRETAPGKVRKDEKIFDIGEDTAEKYKHIIEESKTVLWAGPLGLYENERFSQGTKRLIEIVKSQSDLFSVVGGGDTVKAVEKFGDLDDFSFVSTGGSAMLKYLSGGKLIGLEPLQ